MRRDDGEQLLSGHRLAVQLVILAELEVHHVVDDEELFRRLRVELLELLQVLEANRKPGLLLCPLLPEPLDLRPVVLPADLHGSVIARDPVALVLVEDPGDLRPHDLFHIWCGN